MYHPDTLAIVQLQLEHLDADAGATHYISEQEKTATREGFDRQDAVQKIIRGAIPMVSQAIKRWVEEASKKRGRPSAALAPLEELDPDVVALTALSRVFHTVAKDKMLSATAISLGVGVQVEVEARMIAEADEEAARRYLAMAEGEASERVNLRRHERLKDLLEVGLEWSQRTQMLVGATILNVILKTLPDLFTRGMTEQGRRGSVPAIRFTPLLLDQLSQMTEAAAWMHLIRRPMISPPRRWVHYNTGGYLDYRLSKTVPLIRTFNREHQKMVREAIKNGSMQEELDALNAIQETRFAIDTRVLNVMLQVREDGKQPSKSFPLASVPAIPEKTKPEVWEALPTDTRTALSRKRRSIINIRESASVDATLFLLDIEEAQRLSDVPAFYLPHSMDFRGRVYAVPHFNPQRSDHIKALFRFADTVPMGRDGGYWLSVHLANCGDFDKISKKDFKSRVRWVEDHKDEIIKAARDPMGTYEWWSTADSPFCFLQACMEYADWADSGYSQDFPGCISIALDGSCSGLQHYSAMTRSEEEGYHVNLLPRDTPGDIYQVVADKALPTLQACAHGDDLYGQAAKLILARGFGRSDVKRNVMTYFYGSERFGMRDQHMVDTMRPLADDVALGAIPEHPYALLTERTNKDTGEVTQALDGGFTCAQVLAGHVYSAVVAVAPRADAASSWFQAVAQLLAHESLPVIWRTPTGLPVIQRYSEYTCKKVAMWLYDRTVLVPSGHDKIDGDGSVMSRIECLIRTAPTKRIDKKKARSAISPNVIHSLDASHLKRTVVRATEEGINSFQLIHDSFATHAGNTERFFQIIREAFVSIYETYDPFWEIEAYARSVLSEEGAKKLPPRPERGTLDLSQVLASKYAFA